MLDSTTISILLNKFLVGLMIFLRVSGFLFASPMFQQSAIISQVKVMFGILLTLILTTAFWQEQPSLELHPWVLAILAFKEIMIGVAIGFSAQLVFFAARFAGGLIDFDMGYHTSILFDPVSTTPTLIGELKELIVLMVFLLINGHHYLLEALLVSMKAVPIGTFAVTESTVKLLGEFATSIFIVAIKISAPVLLSLFITNLALALLARIAPQTNIFVLSFQLKVAVGLILLFVTVPFFIYAAKYSLESFQDLTMKILLSLNPGRV
jgi:flagellar biosynthetic protein FliR